MVKKLLLNKAVLFVLCALLVVNYTSVVSYADIDDPMEPFEPITWSVVDGDGQSESIERGIGNFDFDRDNAITNNDHLTAQKLLNDIEVTEELIRLGDFDGNGVFDGADYHSFYWVRHRIVKDPTLASSIDGILSVWAVEKPKEGYFTSKLIVNGTSYDAMMTDSTEVKLLHQKLPDTTKPVITAEDKEVNKGTGLEDAIKDYSAEDDVDGPVDVYVKDDGGYDPNKPGEYTVIIGAKDKAGNEATKEVKITVKDNGSDNGDNNGGDNGGNNDGDNGGSTGNVQGGNKTGGAVSPADKNLKAHNVPRTDDPFGYMAGSALLLLSLGAIGTMLARRKQMN